MKFYASLRNAIELYGYCKAQYSEFLINPEEIEDLSSAIADFEELVLHGMMDYKDWYKKYQSVKTYNYHKG